jgi:hypothetical protein
MADDVYYRGELSVTPPLSESDAKILVAFLDLERTTETQAIFDAIAGSDQPDLPYYGGLLRVSDDRCLIDAGEEESRHGVGLWLRIALKHFFQLRGYSVTGEISWEGSDADDRGCIHVKDNQMDAVDDLIIFPGPSWSPVTFADDHLKEVIKQLLESADNTGCTPDLTVVSAVHLEALKAIHAKLDGSQAAAAA